jgi:hypothetical protein
MQIRQLNHKGLNEFEKFVRVLRSGTQLNIPHYLLEQEEYSVKVNLDVDVDRNKTFATRFEIGFYLDSLLRNHDIQHLIGDQGFWSWFALLWFEQLCPLKNGVARPYKEYNYVLSKRYNHRPRHAIYMTWQLVSRYGEAAKFMLCKEPHTRGEITEQLMARQDILSSESAMRLASKLYYDAANGTFKRGAASRKSAGCVSRFISWIQQLQLNYDIYSITAQGLERLLPKEFERFKDKAAVDLG